MAFGSLYLAGELRKSTAKLLQKKQKKRSSSRKKLTQRDYIEKASRAICEKLISSDDFQNAKKIFVYKAVACEVRLDDLIEKALSLGKEIYYPLCKSKGEMLAPKTRSRYILERGFFRNIRT